MMEKKYYLVCTTPRTGSSLLCSTLFNTGVAGMKPVDEVIRELIFKVVKSKEIENKPYHWQKQEIKQFFESLFKRAATANGISGFKVMWEHLEDIACQIRKKSQYNHISVYELHKLFPENIRYIWLTRKDNVSQAISWFKASQSNTWSFKHQVDYKREYIFNYGQIDWTARVIKRQNMFWKSFFRKNNVEPLILTYEDLIEDLSGAVIQILKYLDIHIPENICVKNKYFRKQSDDISKEWTERYRKIENSFYMRFKCKLFFIFAKGLSMIKEIISRNNTNS